MGTNHEKPMIAIKSTDREMLAILARDPIDGQVRKVFAVPSTAFNISIIFDSLEILTRIRFLKHFSLSTLPFKKSALDIARHFQFGFKNRCTDL